MLDQEYNCPNCEEPYQVDTEGPVIQPCPRCDSPEMVRDFKKGEKK